MNEEDSVKGDVLRSFGSPTAVPHAPEEAGKWQEANRAWWEAHPMRYDWKEGIRAREFSREFFDEIDRRFFLNAEEYLPQDKIPFDALIDFKNLPAMDVLEIGVGNGSHAELLARHAKSFTGIDITDYAVRGTARRLALAHLPVKVSRMDAERMGFRDGSFDFVWSWGVIHHSSNPAAILAEIHRVLRPEGCVVTMVYHRGWWNYYLVGFLRSLIAGDFFCGASLHRSVQLHTDGALARYYTPRELRALAGRHFEVEDIFVTGPKSDLIPVPGGALKRSLERVFPVGLSRFLTRRGRMGSFLVARMTKV